MHQLPTLAQEEQNALLVDHTHALLTLFDQYGQILHVNPACQHLLGYEPADILNSVVDDLVHPDDLLRLQEAWEQVLNAGDAQCTCRVRHQNGAWRWLETRATLAEHHDQCYVITVTHDITEHKQVEDEWQRGNELFRIMVESVKEYAIFATNTDGRIVSWNTGAERVFGYREDEIVGQDTAIIFTPEDRAAGADRQELHTAATAGDAQDERWHLRKDGSRFWANGMMMPLRGETGAMRGFVKVARDDTARKQAEHEREQLIHTLDAQRARLDTVLESISDAFYAVDKDFCFTYVNKKLEAWWQCQRNGLIGQHYWTVFPQALGSESYEKHLQVMRERQPMQYETFSPLIHRWIAVSIYPAQDGGLSVYFRDISARKQAELALRESEERYRTLFTSIDEGFGVVEVLLDDMGTPYDYRFLETNPAYERHTGLHNVVGKTARELGPHEDHWFEVLGNVALTGEPAQFVHCADGFNRWFEGSAFRVGAPERRQVVILFSDITARKQAEDQLRHQAGHDVLTGLPNRATLLDHARRALARHERHPEQCFAVLFLDLDRFKVINDSLGHVVGDHLLVETARRLQQCVRPEDIVARLGGDEFVVLLDSIHDVHDALTVANRIHAALAAPLTLDGHTITTATSIGITLSEQRYTQPEDLLRDADTAMYWAKRRSAGRVAVFDRNMHAQAMERLWMETELQYAIEREQLRIVYQPLVDLRNGRVHGVEALLRWQHPQRGMINPCDFIHVAEETGLIHTIGHWVLREACQQMRQWHRAFPALQPWTISVNLSGVQCRHPELIGQITQVLHETGLEPRCLQLEITESVLLDHTDAATALFRDLRALGVTLTLDDFGTGYSSLSYLHRFPVNTLKVDRSFVCTLDQHEHGALVQTIATLARNLHMHVVAEGVETAAQRDRVAAMGCDYAQGYFFAHPLEPASVERVLVDEASAVGV